MSVSLRFAESNNRETPPCSGVVEQVDFSAVMQNESELGRRIREREPGIRPVIEAGSVHDDLEIRGVADARGDLIGALLVVARVLIWKPDVYVGRNVVRCRVILPV
jgi:hypothetical protein